MLERESVEADRDCVSEQQRLHECRCPLLAANPRRARGPTW